MTLQEKIIAQMLFKLKVYKKNAYEFQNFFTQIMSKYDKEFQTIKPQGKIGDRKNDGYIPSKGIYYQVYAPEKIDANDAIDKMETDLNGLIEYWNPICEIKEYNFVMNDKYLGAYPTINKKISELQEKYNIKTNLILASNLENIFFGLNDEEIQEVLESIITVPQENLSYSALNEVIEGIMNLPVEREISLITPAEMTEKIKFNNLNEQIANILTVHSIYVGQLEEYFYNQSNFERQKVQGILTKIYEDAKNDINEKLEDSSSMIFFLIVDKISPTKKTPSILNAIYILMAYYFESCDIFLNPNNKEKKQC